MAHSEAQPPCVVSVCSLSWARRHGLGGRVFLQESPLVFSQVPKDVACCLCQERPLPESPCRTIQFLCEKLCSTSAPQCGWCPEGLGGSSHLPLLLSLGRCCSTAPCWGSWSPLGVQDLHKTPWVEKFWGLLIPCVSNTVWRRNSSLGHPAAHVQERGQGPRCALQGELRAPLFPRWPVQGQGEQSTVLL